MGIHKEVGMKENIIMWREARKNFTMDSINKPSPLKGHMIIGYGRKTQGDIKYKSTYKSTYETRGDTHTQTHISKEFGLIY